MFRDQNGGISRINKHGSQRLPIFHATGLLQAFSLPPPLAQLIH